MRPYKTPQFDLVVVDVAEWVGDLVDNEVINREWLPWWLKSDFIDILKNALILVLSPGKAFSGVKEHFESFQKTCEIIDRDLVGQKDEFDEEFRDVWEDWTSRSKPKWKSIDKRFSPPK